MDDKIIHEYHYFFRYYPRPECPKITRPPVAIDNRVFEEKRRKILKKRLLSLSSFGLFSERYQIHIYEPLTDLQSHAEMLNYYELLDLAAEQTNPTDRLIYIAAYIISTAYPHYKERKLFKFVSTLGETFEYVDYDKKVLFLGQKVNCYPHVIACHVQGKKWEMSYDSNLTSKLTFSHTLYTCDAIIKIVFKEDGDEYYGEYPNLISHGLGLFNKWREWRGNTTITHKTSFSHAQLNYLGCKKYSNEDCVIGKIYDDEGAIKGTLQGSYLTKLMCKKPDSIENIHIWDRGQDFEIFPNYFGHNTNTLNLNNLNQPIEMLTDSRLRTDVQLLSQGKFTEANQEWRRIQSSIDETIDAPPIPTAEEPLWFTKQYDEKNECKYIYSGDYWKTKIQKYNKSPRGQKVNVLT